MKPKIEAIEPVKDLSEVLTDATAAVNGAATSSADDYGKPGAVTKTNLTAYGRVSADSMEAMGNQAVADAQDFKLWCDQTAKNIRDAAEDESGRAQRYVERMSALKQLIDGPV